MEEADLFLDDICADDDVNTERSCLRSGSSVMLCTTPNDYYFDLRQFTFYLDIASHYVMQKSIQRVDNGTKQDRTIVDVWIDKNTAIW